MNIKELRIGNSVLFNDERVKIVAIDFSEGEPFVLLDNKEIWVSSWMHATMLEPIPITEELLKELGFEEVVEEGLNMFIRFVSAKGCPFGSYIMRVRNLDDEWEFEIPPIYLMRGKYLHELENFVFMTTKKELI